MIFSKCVGIRPALWYQYKELNIYILNNIIMEPKFEKEVLLHAFEYHFENTKILCVHDLVIYFQK